LVTLKDASPESFDQAFGLTLVYETQENPEVRLTHTTSINDLNRLGFRTGYSLGPFPASVTDSQGFMQEDLRGNLPGFEEAFFDADDIEGYPSDSVLAESTRNDGILLAILHRKSGSPL
ncbi:DNA repair protein, partial [Diplocarpon rosae]